MQPTMDQSQSRNQGDSERGLDIAGVAHKRQPSTLKTATRVPGKCPGGCDCTNSVKKQRLLPRDENYAKGVNPRRLAVAVARIARRKRRGNGWRLLFYEHFLQALSGEPLRRIVVAPS